ncbi:MAG TPA: hypothetical protein VF214_09215 [Edaphobacter sp.]
MRIYQARFHIDYALRILRCLQPEERIADGRYAALHFEDSIQLLKLLRVAGLPDEILQGSRTTWTVTFQQLAVLGYTREQLEELGIAPD